MNLSALLDELKSLDINLWLDTEEQLRFRAPKGALTEERRTLIQAHKQAIIDVLKLKQLNEVPEVFRKDSDDFNPKQSTLSCSPAQERMWFLQQFISNKTTYNVCAAFKLYGSLNTANFNQAWQQVIQKHAIFRCQFFQEKDELKQRVLPEITWRTYYHDLSQQADVDIDRTIQAESEHVFNLKSDENFSPLIKVSIFRLNKDVDKPEHLLVINQHHLITDAWSMRLLLKELSERYNAIHNGQSLAADTQQEDNLYLQYIHWQKKLQSNPQHEEQLNYWKQQLHELPILELPNNKPRPAMFSYRGKTHRFLIEPFVVNRVKQFAQSESSSLFMCFLAAYSILLSKYSAQEDFAIATPIANRNQANTQAILGCLINTLALRCKPNGQLNFIDYLRQIKLSSISAYEHQALPFETLVNELDLQRDTAYTPVCQVLFTLQEEALQPEIHLENIQTEWLPQDSSSAKFDISLDLQFHNQQLQASIEYNHDLFSEQFIKSFAWHFQTLLTALIESPDKSLAEQHYLSNSDVQKLIREYNSDDFLPANTTHLHLQLAEQAKRTPYALAIVDGSGKYEDKWTYERLLNTALEYAYTLKDFGLKEDDYIALCTQRNGEFIALSLAAMFCGSVYIPIHANTPQTRIEFILKDSRANFFIAEQHKLNVLPSSGITRLSLEELKQQSAETSRTERSIPITKQENCYCIYTSGSTGNPKGCIISHENLARLFVHGQKHFKFSSQDKGALFHSHAFDFSVWEIWSLLTQGASLHIPSESTVRSSKKYLDFIAKHEISVLNFTPSAFQSLAREEKLILDELAINQHGPLESVRLIIFGGEKLTYSSLQNWVKYHPLDTIKLVNMYGITETTVHASWHVIREQDVYNKDSIIGKPLEDLKFVLLDHHQQVAAPGIRGEIHISGPGVSPGYSFREKENAAAFIENPFIENVAEFIRKKHQTLYATGDVASYNDEALLVYHERKDQQISMRGHRIEPEEIRFALLKIAGIKDAHIHFQKLNDARESLLIAYILTERHYETDYFKSQLKKSLPEYMMPNQFIRVKSWPLNSNGKIDVAQLPSAHFSQGEHQYQPAQNLIEKSIVLLWEQCLNISPISMLDDFFELGGHSLLASQLLHQVEKQFNLSLSLQEFFKHSRPIDMAKIISQGSHNQYSEHVPELSKYTGTENLASLAQENLWAAIIQHPQPASFNIPFILNITGDLNQPNLIKSIHAIAARHAVLRSSFYFNDDNLLCQEIKEDSTPNISIHNCIDFDEDSLQKEIQRHCSLIFNLQTGPLWQTHIFHSGEQRTHVLFVFHHLIADAWSISLFEKELQTCYEKLCAGQIWQPAQLDIDYTDFSAWQQKIKQTTRYKNSLDFWRAQLDPSPAALPLPYINPHKKLSSYHGGVLQFEFNNNMHNALKQFCAQENQTLFTVLMGAYALLISRYSGSNDIIIGTPLNSRKQPALQHIIGYLIHGIVLRCNTQYNQSGKDFLLGIQESLLLAQSQDAIAAYELLSEIRQNKHSHQLNQIAFNFVDEKHLPTRKSWKSLNVDTQLVSIPLCKQELALNIIESKNNLHVEIEFSTELFDVETIKQFFLHYEQLLVEILTKPEQNIHSYTLLSSHQKLSLLGLNTREHTTPWRLNPLQRDMLLHALRFPETRSNTIAYALQLDEKIDIACWRLAVELVQQKLDILNADIHINSNPIGDLAYGSTKKIRHIQVQTINTSLYTSTSDDIYEFIDHYIQKNPLPNSETLSYTLLNCADNKFFFICIANHVLLDGISLLRHAEFCRDVYLELQENESVIPDLSHKFTAGYIQRYRSAMLQAYDDVNFVSFWRKELQECYGLNFTQTQQEQLANNKKSFTHHYTSIKGEQWKNIKQYCWDRRITPAIFFKSLYGLLIAEYTGTQDNFYFIDILSMRDQENMQEIGCFFQQSPMIIPIDLCSLDNIKQLQQHCKSFYQEAIKNSPISPHTINQLSDTGNVSFMFNYYNIFSKRLDFQDHHLKLKEYPPLLEQTVQFIIKESTDAIDLELHYNENLFNDFDFLERILMIAEQLHSKQTPSILFPAERKTLLEHTQVAPAVAESDWVTPFVQQIHDYDNSTAIIYGAQRISYTELYEKSQRFATYLRSQNIKPNSTVAIYLKPSPDWVYAAIAIMSVGACYLPIHPQEAPERIDHILEDSRASTVIYLNQQNKSFAEFNGLHICLTDPDTQIAIEQSHIEDGFIQTGRHAHCIFTSGTTGRPKANFTTHLAFSNLLHWYEDFFQLTPESKTFILSAMSFDLTQKNIFATLQAGGTLFLNADDLYYDAPSITQLIAHYQITHINCPPSLFYPLVQEPLHSLASLKQVVFGGESIKLHALHEWMGNEYFDCQVHNSYGPSECADVASYHTLDANIIKEQVETKYLPIGKARPGVQLFILNYKNNIVPPGICGEICIAGIGINDFHAQHAAAMGDERWRLDTKTHTWVFHTGDIGYSDNDGNLYFLRRKDNQIKLHGMRIEPAEIEYHLRRYDSILDAMVINANERLIAYIICHQEVDKAALLKHLRGCLPTYMLPQTIHPLEKWPLNKHGKIDRAQLPKLLQTVSNKPFIANNPIEEGLVEIFTQILGQTPSVEQQDFFMLGGHSLKASRALQLIEERFDVAISFEDFFLHSDIPSLSAYIHASTWQKEPSQESEVREETFY